MEAPKKIYISTNPITDAPSDEWFKTRCGYDDIEYTRTDVFIEKACEWLEKNIAEATGIDSYTLIESFKQAIKD